MSSLLGKPLYRHCLFGKVITSIVILLGVATTSNATELSGDAGSNRKNGAEFQFTINENDGCSVTISSNQKIRRLAFRNANGRTIFARGVRPQFSITGFVPQLTAHPEGQISIRSLDRRWTRLNGDVNLAFTQCIMGGEEEETEEETGTTVFTNLAADTTCSFASEFIDAVVTMRERNSAVEFFKNSDTATSCFINTVAGSLSGTAGEGALSVVENGGLFAVARLQPGGSSVSEALTGDDASACAVFLGCENFVNSGEETETETEEETGTETETEEETGTAATVFTNLSVPTSCSVANEFVNTVVTIRDRNSAVEFFKNSDAATSCFINTVAGSLNGAVGEGALSVLNTEGGLFSVARIQPGGSTVTELSSADDARACAVFLGCENFLSDPPL